MVIIPLTLKPLMYVMHVCLSSHNSYVCGVCVVIDSHFSMMVPKNFRHRLSCRRQIFAQDWKQPDWQTKQICEPGPVSGIDL